ncbi:MAG: carboxypeptidase regulatory-like domain-containing protein [Bryobacteraceae bacterium]|nr:carboxypeptidase regulatory-like domain-containing protein [Bryobacteraceae bacterium]
MRSQSILAAAAAALLLAATVYAQLTTGTVQGRVIDPSGAVVAGVELSLVQTATNLTFQQTTNAEGLYVFNNVPPGEYSLRTKYASFKSTVINNINVEVNRNTSIAVTIEPGDLQQRVEVNAAAEIIDTQSAVVRTNIGAQMLTVLPSPSRNPLAFAEMAPGVNMNTGALTGGSQVLGLTGVSANVSGGRQQQNTFYLDGADNSTIRRNEGLQMPNVEAIAEVQVVTNTNSAEYGKQPGGYFNVITKSGTNDLHGSGFWFFRDPSLNANEWQRNTRGLARPTTDLRQVGGTIGGPIRRDQTFFFGSFQNFADQAVITSQTTRYPTAALINGDFSAFTGQLYHPDTRQPLPNNRIPSELLDPVAVRIARELIPTVPNLGDRYVYEFQTPPNNNEFLAKGDHNLTSSQRLNVSYFGTRGDTGVLPGAPRALPNLNPGANKVSQNTLSGRHTWLASSRSVLESQFSYAHFLFNSAPDSSAVGRDVSTYGANWPQPVTGGRQLMPDIEILDSFNSPQLTGGEIDQKNYRGTVSLAQTRGAHMLKFGGEVQRSAVRRYDPADASQFRFQGRFSNRGVGPSGTVANALFSHSFADFMMGRVENFTANGQIEYSLPVWGYFGFAQDQWRASRKLTLNFGLRYEIWSAFKEDEGRASAFVEGHQSDQFPNVPRNVAFQGDRGIRDGFIPQDRNNFAPRIGVAYDVFGDNKTVIRGGYGLYYAFPGAQIRTFSTEEWPQRPSIQGFEARLNNPWLTSVTPKFTSLPAPFPENTLDWIRNTRFAPPYPRIIAFNDEFTTPVSHQYNVTVEREIRNGVTANIGYVASLGRNLLQGIPFNYARFRTVNGQPPSSAAANIVARLAFPDFSQFSIRNDTRAKSNYHSLQASSNVRLGGLNFRVTYVYARDFGDSGGARGFTTPDEDPTGFTTQANNPANPSGEYGRRSRLHTFRAFYAYDLPFLRGSKTVAARVLGGWQISGSTSIFSGDPIDITLGYDANFDAITSRPQDRPDLVAPIRYTGGSPDAQMRRYFDPSSFARPVITENYLFGNLMRNALYSPGRWSTDLALIKNFAITERFRAQFRAEAYNWVNHPNLDDPVTSMSAGDFGRILTKSGNRTMQMGLRVSF